MSELAPSALHAELRSLIASLITSSRQRLVQEFGRGFEAKNLRGMVQFAQTFRCPRLSRHCQDN